MKTMDSIQGPRRTTRRLPWLALCAGGILALPAQAEEVAPIVPPLPPVERLANVDEVVVSARQRGETLMEVPVSVTAVGAEQFSKLGSTDIRDVTTFVPSLQLGRTSSGTGGFLAIRGIGTAAGQAGFDQAVSVSVDGIQTGRSRVLTQGLFDVEQVEVLKGPQALFFGKNSPAGVISIKTAGATDTLEGYARASYEFVGEEPVIEGAVSGPLSDALGARLAFRYRNLNGWLRNVGGQFTPATYPFPADGGVPALGVRRPGDEEMIGRLTLEYRPAGGNFDATLKFTASDYSSDGPAAGQQLSACGAFNTGVTANRPDPFGECVLDNKYSASGLPDGVADKWPYARQQPYQNLKMYLTGLTANYRFANLTLTSVTGYFWFDNKSFDNYDATSFLQFGAAEHEEYSAFSQEFRLLSGFEGPVNFMLGAYFQDTNLSFLNSSKIRALGPDPTPGPNLGKFQTWEKPGETDGKTYSVFGQLIWNITEQIELAGGVRYTKETKDSTLFNSYVHPPLSGTSFAPPSRLFTDAFRDSNFSPEATLTWRPTEELTTYIAYKTGYKSGGFGLSAVLSPATITEDSIRFDSEHVKGFEGGIKAELLDRRLRTSLSLYSYKYSDLQVNSFNPATTSFTITNAAAARLRGVEFDANFRANDALTLYGALAYTDAHFIDYIASCYGGQTFAQGCNVPVGPGADQVLGTADDTFGQDMQGNPLGRAPKWAVTAGFNLELPLTGSWNIGFNGNARYASELFSDNPNGVQPSYWVIDAGIRVLSTDDRWQVALIGRNLTNEYYASGATEKPGAPTTPGTPTQVYSTPNRGRQIMLEVTARY